MDIEEIRKAFESCVTEDDYYLLSNELQLLGYRACPRNVMCSDTARSICPVYMERKKCRCRIATCWKMYFKAIKNDKK